MKLRFGLVVVGILALATCALPSFAQQVAPVVQPVWNNNGSPQPVTSSSGLPVNCISGCTGGGSAATPSAGPLPTASAGAAPPAQAPYTNSNANCQVPAGGTPNVTGGNSIALQCDSHGRLLSPIATANPSFPPNAVPQILYGAAGTQIPGLPIGCNRTFTFGTASATATWLLVQASAAGTAIYICGYSIATTSTLTGSSVYFASSASNSCTSMTNLADITPTSGVQIDSSPIWRGIGGPQPFLGLASCVNIAAIAPGVPFHINVYYTQMSPGP